MENYFSSDFHLSHKKLMEVREIDSLESMDNLILERFGDTVKDKSNFYFAGDLSWSPKATRRFFDLVHKKGINFYWALGNHERSRKDYKDFIPDCHCIQHILDIKIEGQPITICHYPMISWNKSHYGAWQLFGHHHEHKPGGTPSRLAALTLGKQLNINLEFHDYKPWNFQEIVEYMKTKDNNWDLVVKDNI
jgi:calcineurin-like phosphoesterase family protein